MKAFSRRGLALLPPPLAQRILNSPLGYRLASATLWSLLGTLTAKGLAVSASILVAWRLGAEGFGALAIVQSTVTMFEVFASFGMGLTATKYIAEYRLTEPTKAGRIMALSQVIALIAGGALAVVLFIAAPWLAEHTLDAPQLGGLLRISAGLLLLSALCGAQTGALLGFEAFRTLALINGLIGLSQFLLLTGGAYLAGLKGAVWGLMAGHCVHWLVNHLALQREASAAGVALHYAGCWRESNILYGFSLPAVLGGVMVGPVNWICNALLVNQPNGLAEMGIFNAANQWRAVILFLPGKVGIAAFPMLANLYGLGQRGHYAKLFKYNMLLNGAVALLIALPVIGLARWIMGSYGTAFVAGQQVLVWLALSAIPIALADVIGQAIASQGRMWSGFYLNGLWAAVFIGLAFLLIDRGASGLALATLIAYSVHLINVGIYAVYINNDHFFKSR